MKFGKLRRICNARRYDLFVYSGDGTLVTRALDMEDQTDKARAALYDGSRVDRINAGWERDADGDIRPILEVELYV